MITAVLKLLAATIPTSGSNITPITTRLATFPMFLDNFSTRTAKNNMTTSFAISDGWNCIGPSASHLDDPCESVPIPQNIYKYTKHKGNHICKCIKFLPESIVNLCSQIHKHRTDRNISYLPFLNSTHCLHTYLLRYRHLNCTT